MVLRNILLCALIVGTLSGIVYGLFQQTQISPIIYAAEIYEVKEAAPAHSHGTAETAHHHDSEAWGPRDGFERIFYTLSANIAVAFAFALVVISLMIFHNQKSNKPSITPLQGAFWGIATLLSFFVAPALFGLHPEVPGTEAAKLEYRQIWWLFCAGATAVGIAVIYYASAKFKIAGLVIAALPHVFGAPISTQLSFANKTPEAIAALTELSHQFYYLTGIGMAIFFILLCTLSAYAVSKYIKI